MEGTDVMSFKFSRQDNQVEEDKTPLLSDYAAGQFAFFDIGGVNNDPKGPIRHFTISSSPTEDFIMFTTRIRDSPYKKRLSTLEDGPKSRLGVLRDNLCYMTIIQSLLYFFLVE